MQNISGLAASCWLVGCALLAGYWGRRTQGASQSTARPPKETNGSANLLCNPHLYSATFPTIPSSPLSLSLLCCICDESASPVDSPSDDICPGKQSNGRRRCWLIIILHSIQGSTEDRRTEGRGGQTLLLIHNEGFSLLSFYPPCGHQSPRMRHYFFRLPFWWWTGGDRIGFWQFSCAPSAVLIIFSAKKQ